MQDIPHHSTWINKVESDWRRHLTSTWPPHEYAHMCASIPAHVCTHAHTHTHLHLSEREREMTNSGYFFCAPEWVIGQTDVEPSTFGLCTYAHKHTNKPTYTTVVTGMLWHRSYNTGYKVQQLFLSLTLLLSNVKMAEKEVSDMHVAMFPPPPVQEPIYPTR